MMAPSSDSVLYFPSIEFGDDNWVKQSLLLWDKVYRIVPTDYVPDDSPAILHAVDNDFVRSIVPEQRDLAATAAAFADFCNDLGDLPAGLIGDMDDRLHVNKIDRRLYPFLESLATSFDDGFLQISRPIARAYMFDLSEAVAERRNLARATDDSDSWTVAAYFAEDGNFSDFVYDPEPEGFYCNVVLDNLLPIDLSETPISTILQFADSNRELRRAFRESVHKLCSELEQCDSPEFAMDIISDRRAELERLKHEYRRSMGFANKNDLLSTLVVGVPVALSVLGVLPNHGNPFSLINISESVLFGAVAALAHYKIVGRGDRGNAVGSYLLELDRQLAAQKTHRQYGRLFEEFIND